MAQIKPTPTRPTDEALRTMVASKMTTVEIATHCRAGLHAVRRWLNAAGCNSDLKGGWHMPTLEPAQPAPKPTAKSVLHEQFPFIRTRKIASRNGTEITMPRISMRVVESGKFGNIQAAAKAGA
jgi:hypothetical protein